MPKYDMSITDWIVYLEGTAQGLKVNPNSLANFDLDMIESLLDAFMKNNWIAVEYKIPDNNVSVLVYTKDGMVTAHVETNSQGFNWVINDQNEEFNLTGVTHWMPLPDPPS